MWYRSFHTGKIIHRSAAHLINNLYGEDAFDALVETGILSEVENPSVIDVLLDTHSLNLAALRYRELNKCTVKEAKFKVKQLKREIASFKNNKKGHKKQWKKKNAAAKTASSESASDTTK